MDNRKFIAECLDKIYNRFSNLKNIVDNTSDESLQDILDNLFYEYTVNIEANFSFLEMIVSRSISENEISEELKTEMTNEELVKYFDEHWDRLISPCG